MATNGTKERRGEGETRTSCTQEEKQASTHDTSVQIRPALFLAAAALLESALHASPVALWLAALACGCCWRLASCSLAPLSLVVRAPSLALAPGASLCSRQRFVCRLWCRQLVLADSAGCSESRAARKRGEGARQQPLLDVEVSARERTAGKVRRERARSPLQKPLEEKRGRDFERQKEEKRARDRATKGRRGAKQRTPAEASNSPSLPIVLELKLALP